MGIIIGAVIGAVILPVALTIFYALEQHDKTTRERQGLPQKKYHDITDMDVTTVYTINHRK